MLPVILHSLALFVALGVQALMSPLAGMWLFLFLAGCMFLLRNGYPDKNLVWYASLAWLLALSLSCFIVRPVIGGAASMWLLAAMPMLGICIHKKYLKYYVIGFGVVISIFAAGLILQQIFNVQYTNGGNGGHSWPLLDENNAALVVNFGVITSFYLALRRWRYFGLFLFFATALAITHSKAGLLAAAVSCSILAAERFGMWILLPESAAGMAAFMTILSYKPEWILRATQSFYDRLPIWYVAFPMVGVKPWSGLGLGTFGYYYRQIRLEDYTAGWYAHNDLLQFAIEMGFPLAMVFVLLVGAVIARTCRANIAAACVLLAALIQSMLEFQFYVPAVSILAGLALAYHSRARI